MKILCHTQYKLLCSHDFLELNFTWYSFAVCLLSFLIHCPYAYLMTEFSYSLIWIGDDTTAWDRARVREGSGELRMNLFPGHGPHDVSQSYACLTGTFLGPGGLRTEGSSCGVARGSSDLFTSFRLEFLLYCLFQAHCLWQRGEWQAGV